jgi:hypothetical protein
VTTADEPTLSDEPTGDLEQRSRFEAALGAYVAAIDAGQSLDRQKFLAGHPRPGERARQILR